MSDHPPHMTRRDLSPSTDDSTSSASEHSLLNDTDSLDSRSSPIPCEIVATGQVHFFRTGNPFKPHSVVEHWHCRTPLSQVIHKCCQSDTSILESANDPSRAPLSLVGSTTISPAWRCHLRSHCLHLGSHRLWSEFSSRWKSWCLC